MKYLYKNNDMNKSYSKIRHIQESNRRLEERLLNEQDSIPNNSSWDTFKNFMCKEGGYPFFKDYSNYIYWGPETYLSEQSCKYKTITIRQLGNVVEIKPYYKCDQMESWLRDVQSFLKGKGYTNIQVSQDGNQPVIKLTIDFKNPQKLKKDISELVK